MADEPEDRPSLEMPTFSLRRRKSAPDEDEVAEPTAQTPVPPAPDPGPETPTAVAPDVREPAPEPPDTGPGRRRPTITIGGLPAAALAGLLVGSLAVLISLLAGAACEAVRGTSSCGGGAGLPLLLATLVVLAYAGALLLGVLGVDEAGSTSLLAVGVLAVLVMVFLLDSLDEGWVLVAVPVAAVVAYTGSWWLTQSVVGEDAEAGASTPHDVR